MKAKQKLKKLLLLLILPMLVLTTSCSKDDGPSLNNLSGILTFSFTDPVIKDFPFEVDNVNYVIKNTDSLPYQFDTSSLTAMFTVIPGSTVTVGGTIQTSGTTVNNFSNDVTYVVTSEDGSDVKNYRVKLNVAQLNPEGLQWKQKSPNAFDSTFETQEYFYLNGKHWVILGKKFQHFVNNPEAKLYSSADGASWVEETPSGDFPIGFDHNVVVHDNVAYVVGVVTGVDTWGAMQPNIEKHLYSTTDGITWIKTEDALDVSRILTSAFTLNNGIYVFGGNKQGGFGSFLGSKASDAPYFPAGGIVETTLFSANGSSFAPTAAYTEDMPKRTLTAGYVVDDKMYIAGGLDALGHPLNDVWSSSDGVNWTEVSNGGFSARIKASTVAYAGKIYMFGGQLADGTCATETLVSSDNGITWEVVDQDQALPDNFKARCNADAWVDADGYLWIVGGQEVVSVTHNDEGMITDIEYKTLTDVWSGKLNSFE